MITITEIRAFSDNYIWLLECQGETRVAVVDPGDAGPVVEALDARGLELGAIITTHHHGDHVGGVTELLSRWQVPVYGPAGETIPGRTHALSEGDRIRIDFLDLDLDVFDVPGHTAGHIAYAGDGMLFCGDTLFAGGCGRLFEGTPEQMYTSLGKLAKLPKETRVYCAHEYTEANLRFASRVEPDNEPLRARLESVRALRADDRCTLPSTLGEELETNPFLRADVPNVKQSAEKHVGHGLTGPVDVFAAVRRWKDTG